jgi:geranyl-CoA carboxylase beta subunit
MLLPTLKAILVARKCALAKISDLGNICETPFHFYANTLVRLSSSIRPESSQYKDQRAAMMSLVEQVRELQDRIRDRSNSQRARFEERGQLLPRERLELLFDPGTEVLELSHLAGYKLHDDDGDKDVLGGGVISRIGFVEGVRVMALANDSAIKSGATMPLGLKKYLRAQEIALTNRLPVIMLVEAAGANLNYQAEVFVEGGRRFYNMAKLSAAGIPQIAVVHGSCTAGGAYIPGMSDYVVMVRGRAKIFLAGPPLLKAATGEIATDEELGGAEMHSTVAGTSEFVVENDAEAIAAAREIVRSFGWNERLPVRPSRAFAPPHYDPEDLCGVVPTDYRRPYDIREIIARLVDGSDFVEVKARYGANMVCGRGFVGGLSCGFIGNNGPIRSEEAVKTAQFIQQCCQTGTPITFLQNTTGYMVGTAAERSGIIKHGAKMIQAVSNATVPIVTFIVGGSFGAGNFGMCGRSFSPRFLFSWPNARISVMGGEQAATVMSIVTEEKQKRAGKQVDKRRLEAMRAEIMQRFEDESSVLFATARVWDDGIIDPRSTRRILHMCLQMFEEAENRELHPNSFGVARM